MKVTIERSVFLKALSHVQSVVERRNTIPILSNVLLNAEGGQLGLTATDLDMEISETAPADVAEPGAATTSAHTLYEIVRRLPEGAQVRLELVAGEARLKLAAGRSDFSLAVLPNDDFPTMDADDLGVQFAAPAAELKRLIDKTRFAISTEETRYYLNGIYLHPYLQGGTPSLRAVATDGHRLARVDADLPDGAADMPGVIAPRKAIGELRRLLEDAGDTVSVAVSDAKIRFAFDNVVLTSKLIDGTFPDYERVIPSGNDKMMKVENADFISAVDRVSTVSAEKTRSVKLAMEADRLRLAVNNPESGSALEELSVEYGAEAIEIGFNARYLMDVAKEVDGATSTFKFADSASPTLILDEEDPRALYVLMPMRV
ncbi:MAG: DNA polymerase III subunit beta [Pseudomonadota bacterium]